MAIENSVSNDFYLRSSIVLAFSIAVDPVCFWYGTINLEWSIVYTEGSHVIVSK